MSAEAPARPRRLAADDPEPEPRSGSELIEAAASERPDITPAEAQSALDWLLSDEPEQEELPTDTLELNVGGPENPDGSAANPTNPPRWIQWTISPVEEGIIRKILNASGGNRRQRRANRGGADEGVDANLQIVVAGTVTPDLAQASASFNQKHPDRANVNAAGIVKQKFKRKPGLIGQIADAIMEMSGFNEDDVRDAREVRAAGN